MLRGERPLIAIDGEMTLGEAPSAILDNRYARAVLEAGGIPVVVPPAGGPSDVRRVLERVDGVLFSGGADFDMARLGLGATHPAAKPVASAKQDFDFEFARAALELELPVLGICYGMQLLGLATGGRLHQHLPDVWPGSIVHSGGATHFIDVDPASRLGRTLALERVEVVSSHHQALSSVGAGWSVCACDGEGLIEALELSERPFVIGVQWHPERGEPGGPQTRLFRALVFAAASRSIARAHPVPVAAP